jgi:glycosyltransferase involved in cell wall biosynthesis
MTKTNSDKTPRIIVLAPNAWAAQWVNRQQLFSRLGRKYPVLYSTGGWFSWDRNGSDWKQSTVTGKFSPHENVWVDESPRFFLRVPRFPLLDNWVLRLQVRRWKRFLSARGSGRLVAYVFHPMFIPYVRLLGADYLVYHAYDLYENTADWNDALDRDERTLIKLADLAIASSDQIADVLQKKTSREVRVLPNGADVAAFDRALEIPSPAPEDLLCIPHPRLGWVGSLHPQVDYGLIATLAKRRSDWNFVLVGQVIPHPDPRSDAERADCETLPNVHFLGGKKADEIPRYLVGMDVNIMPYRLSDRSWIKAGYPLKLHEYLAVGHPVVSADLPSVRPFSHVVRIAEGVDDWYKGIEDALDSGGVGTPELRRAVAAENSWDARVLTLSTWLTKLVNKL